MLIAGSLLFEQGIRRFSEQIKITRLHFAVLSLECLYIRAWNLYISVLNRAETVDIAVIYSK